MDTGKKITEKAKAVNEIIARKFVGVNHRDVIRDMMQYPDKLELFQIQCLSLATLALEIDNPVMNELADIYCEGAARSALVVESVREANEIVKGN